MISERKVGGFSLFALWFGAAVSLAEIITGSAIAPLGINCSCNYGYGTFRRNGSKLSGKSSSRDV